MTRDPADDYLVALAHATEAELLVSGDRDLLDAPDLRTPVVTPRLFLDRLETKRKTHRRARGGQRRQ